MSKKNYSGFAIALAWPGTFCKQPGSWYDPLTLWLGINKNHYYRVGHAAVVLVDTENNKCHYFDFGRYHAPFQHGRVRSADTDHELEMKIAPVISKDKRTILNLREILAERQGNAACHGEGELSGSYCQVDFHSAFNKAVEMQKNSSIPYGPFRKKGSNCSRFVNTTIQAGNPGGRFRFGLKYRRILTPTPLNNVRSLKNHLVIPANPKVIRFKPIQRLDNVQLRGTLAQPSKHPNIPSNAQWLSGEGAGSWFSFRFKETSLEVTRYSPNGVVECDGIYESGIPGMNQSIQHLKIAYPSDCNKITLDDSGKTMQFNRVSG